MSDAPAPRRRLRWISIAELVALIGVVIAALGLWSNWSERRGDEAQRAADQAASVRQAGRVDLTGTPRNGGRELLLRDPRHEIQDATIVFPTALGVAAQHPLADPVIAAGPLRDPLLKGNDRKLGRLPVLVTIRFVDGDASRSETSIYDLVWTTDKPLLGGRSLKLEGLRLHRRGGTRAGLDALWKREGAGASG